jgi:hypothetical protein
MKNFIYTFSLIIFIVAGFIFFLYQESWLIINLPSQSKSLSPTFTNKSEYQETVLYIWNHNRIEKETGQILKTGHRAEVIQDLINQFLKLCQEADSIQQATHVQSVIWSDNQKTIFISFNQSLFDKQSSTFEKLMIIDSLLKTLKNTQLDIAYVQFLVNHQPLQDSHLNFEIPWPMSGIDS